MIVYIVFIDLKGFSTLFFSSEGVERVEGVFFGFRSAFRSFRSELFSAQRQHGLQPALVVGDVQHELQDHMGLQRLLRAALKRLLRRAKRLLVTRCLLILFKGFKGEPKALEVSAMQGQEGLQAPLEVAHKALVQLRPVLPT